MTLSALIFLFREYLLLDIERYHFNLQPIQALLEYTPIEIIQISHSSGQFYNISGQIIFHSLQPFVS